MLAGPHSEDAVDVDAKNVFTASAITAITSQKKPKEASAMSEQPLTPESIREALRIWCDSVDAGTTQLRMNLGGQQPKKAEMPKSHVDASKLAWTLIPAPANPKGPWEMTTEHGNPVYAELQKILEPKSPLAIDGFLYWLSPAKDYIGRRAFKKKA